MLRARSDVPRVVLGAGGDERLIILPGEDIEKTTAAGVCTSSSVIARPPE
jgi:hypothetical protein